MDLITILQRCHRFPGFVYQHASFSGLNNKVKVTMRKTYGIRTYRVLELALYHSLGELTQPESAHDFF